MGFGWKHDGQLTHDCNFSQGALRAKHENGGSRRIG